MRFAVLRRSARRVLPERNRSTGAQVGSVEGLSFGLGDSDHLAHMRSAGAGRYFDPEDVAIYRYWDGAGWTERLADVLPSRSGIL